MENHPQHNHQGIRNIKTAFILNLSFTLLEIVGGFLTNSIAILSDALHDLGDSLSLGLSWYLETISAKKRDRRFSFGYRRFSLLAALINSVVLIGGSVWVLSVAIPRLINPEVVSAEGMLFLSIIGILVNGMAVWRLRGNKSLNERVVAWHLLEDVLGWVAVFTISLVMLFWEIPVLDPILSILFTGFVLWNVVKRLKETVVIFLQAVPPGFDTSAIENQLSGLENVQSVHDTHIWSLDGEYHILSTHVVVENNASGTDIIRIKTQVKDLCKQAELSHVTVEIESEDEYCGTVDC